MELKQERRGRTLTSKWIKTKALLKNKEMRNYIPETRLYSRSSLRTMIKKHNMVYVKPINGTAGNGVIQASKMANRRFSGYRYQLGTMKRAFRSFDKFYTSMNRNKLKRPYLVQQGIHLLTFNGLRFDVRVMVQRTAKLDWRTTGYVGRVSHPKKIVTNYHSQGKPLPLEQLLAPYLKGKQKQQYLAQLQRLGVRIAKQLQRTYPNFREIGVDIALDSNLHPWVLEVNTAPDVHIFNAIRDKRMFRTVLRYSKANGRYTKVKG